MYVKESQMEKDKKQTLTKYPILHEILAPEPLDSTAALQELVTYFLGEDWFVSGLHSSAQINAVAVQEIKRLYKNRKQLKSRSYKLYKYIP